MASRGHAGGLAATSTAAATVLDAAGFDIVLLETVGTGQSEVEVAAAADTTVVLEAPEMGDEVQAIKAGLLEVADIVVVNKGDRPGAQRTAAQLRAMLVPTVGPQGPRPDRPTPKRPEVLVTTASTGDGRPGAASRRSTGTARSSARGDARGSPRPGGGAGPGDPGREDARTACRRPGTTPRPATSTRPSRATSSTRTPRPTACWGSWTTAPRRPARR